MTDRGEGVWGHGCKAPRGVQGLQNIIIKKHKSTHFSPFDWGPRPLGSPVYATEASPSPSSTSK